MTEHNDSEEAARHLRMREAAIQQQKIQVNASRPHKQIQQNGDGESDYESGNEDEDNFYDTAFKEHRLNVLSGENLSEIPPSSLDGNQRSYADFSASGTHHRHLPSLDNEGSN